MGASENGNGAGGGTELKPLPDARVYRMTLKQNGQIPYYNDSYALGLVGIGWWEWARPSFREKLPGGLLKDKLDRAISRGVQYGSPEQATPTGAAKASEFPVDKVAILLSEDLTLEEADAFRKHWSEIATKDLEKEGAEEVALFLSAREGDIVVTRDAGVLRWGLFAKDLQDPKGEAKGELQPLSVGGHICRPVRWAGSVSEATTWLQRAGFLNTDHIVSQPRWNTIRVFERDVPKGKDKIEKIIGFKPKSGAIHMGRTGSPRHSSEEYPLRDLLRRSKTIILEGVPGTGKTYAIKNEICKRWKGADGAQELGGRGDGHYATTLHPATSYEDFVEGLRPVAKQDTGASSSPGPSGDPKPVLIGTGEQPELATVEKIRNHRYFHAQLPDIHGVSAGFAVQDGFFLRVCAEAVNNPKNDYVVLLDEFNRCNVPKVMGDLLTTMERSKRAQWDDERNAWDLSRCQVVTLPASKRLFFVPENVYVVATMNSTDRSVAPLDSALRRRFAFHRCWPLGFGPQDNRTDEGDKGNKNEVTDEKAKVEKARVERVVTEAEEKIGKDDRSIKVFNASVEAWVKINMLLLKAGGPDALLGHSYLMDLADDLGKLSGVEEDDATRHVWVEHHWNHHILPQLADVLITHTLESLLETKAAEAGEILKIKVGERRIVQPAETVRDGRGQYGTLVLRLDERVLTAERKKPGSTPKRKDWTLPNVLGEDQIGSGFCGIRFSTSSGTGADTRKHVINSFWGKLKDPTCPRPLSFWFAKEGEFGKEQIAEVAEGSLDVNYYQLKIEKRAEDYGQGHFGYPWACYFRSEDLNAVEKLIEELRGDAPSA